MTQAMGRGTTVVDGETYATDTFVAGGKQFTIRELSVDEGDDIFEAAQEPIDPKDLAKGTKTNGRLNTRLLIAKAIVEPPTLPGQIGKWPGPKFTTVLRHFNDINSIDESDPTPPAGSAGPTSPSGGEPTQPNSDD